MNGRIQQNHPTILRFLASGLSILICAGCSTHGYQKGDAAATTMQRAASEVEAESRALDQTVASLRQLVTEPNGDLRAPFKRYSRNLDRLIATAQRTENTAHTMEQRNLAYVQAWDLELQSMDYQHIRELSEARRNEVTNHFVAVQQRYQESQAVVQPVISYFLDIRKALSTDLTTAGLQSLRGVVQNANDNVVKVQTALDALTTELTNSSARLSSIAYEAGPPTSPPSARQ